MKFRFIIALYLSSSCNNAVKSPGKIDNDYTVRNDKIVTIEQKDTMKYTQLTVDFYLGEDSQLYEKKFTAVDPETMIRYSFYDSRLVVDYTDSFITESLSSKIDIATYRSLDSCSYSKDVKHVYYFNGTSDGGFRFIVKGADPITFQCLVPSDYTWGIDKNWVYYKGDALTKLNPKKMEVLMLPNWPWVDYVKDDKWVYHGNLLVKGADANSFRIIKDTGGVDAVDKYRRYSGGYAKQN